MSRPLKPSQRAGLAKLPRHKGNWIEGEMDGRKFILTQIPSRPVWEVTTPEGIQITVCWLLGEGQTMIPTQDDIDLAEAMAFAMWADYAAGAGVTCTRQHWLEKYTASNEESKDGFRRSARVAIKAAAKAGFKFVRQP